jgi:hypothetical protein
MPNDWAKTLTRVATALTGYLLVWFVYFLAALVIALIAFLILVATVNLWQLGSLWRVASVMLATIAFGSLAKLIMCDRGWA